MAPNVKRNNVKTTSLGPKNISPKTLAAFTLVAVMALLWGRVLLKGKGGPSTAAAQTTEQQTQQELTSQSTGIEVIAIPLTVLEGRHDQLSSNLFSADNWTAFEFHEKDPEPVAEVVKETPREDPQERLRKKHRANLEQISKRLALEAIIRGADGKPSKVFIDDKILTVGTVLTVQEGPDTYDLTLTELSEKEALFDWDGFSLVLHLAETGQQ